MIKSMSIVEKYPESLKYWDYDKNNFNNPNDITYGTCKKYYWKCKSGHSSYERPIDIGNRNFSCKICDGKTILKGFNDLWTTHPNIAKMLKNPEDGYTLSFGSNKIIPWKCNKGHVTYRSPNNMRENTCPICRGREVLVGFNDLWTTNPSIASMLENKDDGYKFTHGSHRKVNWICPYCNNKVANKKIVDVVLQGLPCNICGDGVSYPEKMMSSLLNYLNIDYIYQLSRTYFKWCKRYRYDFYIPSKNLIVEIHGGFHYREAYHSDKSRTLEEVQNIDIIKEKLAKNNGISNYIIINADKSNFDFIKENILKSEFAKIYDLSNVNWNIVETNIIDNMVVYVCNYFNNHIGESTFEIASRLKLHQNTIVKYLNIGAKIGLCNYKPFEYRTLVNKKKNRRCKPVICDTTGEYFNSITEAEKFYGIRNISECCHGRRNYAGKNSKGQNLVWRYA